VSDAPLSREFLALRAALADRYTLQRELGAGGMATVYLVQDLKHDRRVALKVLRPELAAVIGAQRFLQEIKTTANLQHPHILGLIDSGETEHQLWYVMPYVQGESLRDRITREKQLPVGDAVRLATEVAGALDYAHRHGVIHRDIKPENILLHEGRALVADFGIALAASKAGSRMTESGMSLGTPHYMSPEQAMGEREITARSDVYALGCILYEMLIGVPPFTGPTAQAIVAKVLTGEPASLRAERKSVPPHVEATVLQALEKLPADRFASAAEFAVALGNPAFTSTHSVAIPPARGRIPALAWLPWALLVAVIGVVAFDGLRPKPEPAPAPVQRFDVLLPEDAEWVEESGSGVALSPDGTTLAYTGRDSSAQRRIYLRSMGRFDPIVIPGSEYGALPVFSPDGRWVAFIANSGIVKVPVAGGPQEPVCRSGGYVNGTWLESNVIVFASGADPALRQCSATGEASTLFAGDSAETFNFPHGLPGDRGVLFTIRRRSTDRLVVLDLRTRAVKPLGISGTDARYVATGHLVYASSDGVLRAVRFDPKELEATGEPVMVEEGIRVAPSGKAMIALSRTGVLVAAGSAASKRTLELVDRQGRAEPLYARRGDYLDPRLSPDGRRIAVAIGPDIWVLDRAQGALTRQSFDSSAMRPVWTHDGRQVAYVRQIGARVDLRRIDADGSAPAESLLAMSGFGLWEVLFPLDGLSMVVRSIGGPGNRELWRIPLDPAGEPVRLLETPADEVSPAVSPDGRWIAYASNESGRYEIYVRPFPGMGARYPVSLQGGTEPLWSPLSNELFYRSGPALVAAEVRAATTFEVLRRTTLFSNGDYAADPTHQGYDVTPDGRHFVMVRNVGGASRLTVTLHAFANLGSAGSGAAPAVRPR
jgi:serine/threonine-protein kinase